MYLWKYKDMAKTLRDGKISRAAHSAYVIIFVILSLLLWLPSLLAMAEGNFLAGINLVQLALWIGIPYYVNKKGDGKYFIRRFICLFLPVVLRSLVFLLVFAVPVAVLFGAASIADAMSGGNQTGFLTGDGSKLIATGIITLMGLWFMLVYPVIIFVRGFKIASGQSEGMP